MEKGICMLSADFLKWFQHIWLYMFENSPWVKLSKSESKPVNWDTAFQHAHKSSPYASQDADIVAPFFFFYLSCLD